MEIRRQLKSQNGEKCNPYAFTIFSRWKLIIMTYNNYHHYDYSCVPLSRQYNTERNVQYRAVVNKYRADIKNNTLGENDKRCLAPICIEKAARDGNMDLLQAFLPFWQRDPDDLWRDLQHTVARNHFDAFCCIVQYMTEHNSAAVFKGLEAALYFGRQNFVDAVLPHCRAFSDETKMQTCVAAALEGNHCSLAQQIMPFAYTGRGLVHQISDALLEKNFEKAEVWYPYSSVKLVRKNLMDLNARLNIRKTVGALEWLEHRANQEMAKKISKRIKVHTTQKSSSRKM